MRWRFFFAVSFLALAATACSDSGSGKTGAGQKAPPGTTFPELLRGAPLLLPSTLDLSAIQELFPQFPVVGPLVGDPKLVLTLQKTNTLLQGSLLFFVEDAEGAYWMEQNSYDKTGYLSNTGSASEQFDIIFQDDFAVTRVQASLSGGALTGSFLYRVRELPLTDDAPCRIRNHSCQIVGTPPPWVPVPPECQPGYVPPDEVGPCRNYMNPALSAVRTLGTFEQVPQSFWIAP